MSPKSQIGLFSNMPTVSEISLNSLPIKSMRRYWEIWPILFLLLLVSSSVGGQTSQAAQHYLKDFDDKGWELNRDWCRYLQQNFFSLNTECLDQDYATWKSKADKYMRHFQSRPDLVGQSQLKNAFVKWTEEISRNDFLVCHPAIESKKSDDAETSQWQIRLQEYGQATRKLDEERKKFILMNRIPKEKAPKLMAPDVENWIKIYQQAWQLYRFHNLLKIVVKDQLESFTSDINPSGSPSGFEQKMGFCDSVTLLVKSLPAQPGDQKLREAVLQSLRSYRLEMKNDWPKVAGFVKGEQDFSRLNQEMKAKKDPTPEEKDRFRMAVRQYNETIKQANTLLRGMEANRKAHEAKVLAELEIYLKANLI